MYWMYPYPRSTAIAARTNGFKSFRSFTRNPLFIYPLITRYSKLATICFISCLNLIHPFCNNSILSVTLIFSNFFVGVLDAPDRVRTSRLALWKRPEDEKLAPKKRAFSCSSVGGESRTACPWVPNVSWKLGAGTMSSFCDTSHSCKSKELILFWDFLEIELNSTMDSDQSMK